MRSAALVLGATGLFGLLYAAIVIVRTRRQKGYTPVFEDWLWHAALPVVAYGALAIGGFELTSHEHEALFAVGAATLLLVFIGIHNAWDTVTFLVLMRVQREAGADEPDATPATSSAEHA
jgi:hypothetical protein